MLAWRVLPGQKSSHKQISNPLKAAPGAGPLDPVTAHWPDGDSWEVSDVTAGDLGPKAKAKKTSTSELWSGIHVKSKNSLE
eukprot:3850497-Alexandrium_andersonii.AAC.1